jgi:hypothetical protein
MDTFITFVEVKGFLKNRPSCMPRPDFTRLCVLGWHMIEALKQLSCPQSGIHGWAGLIMHPTMYALIKMIPFAVPHNPGDVLTLPSFGAPTAIKIAERLLKGTRGISRLINLSIVHASRCSMITLQKSSNCQPKSDSKAGI